MKIEFLWCLVVLGRRDIRSTQVRQHGDATQRSNQGAHQGATTASLQARVLGGHRTERRTGSSTRQSMSVRRRQRRIRVGFLRQQLTVRYRQRLRCLPRLRDTLHCTVSCSGFLKLELHSDIENT